MEDTTKVTREYSIIFQSEWWGENLTDFFRIGGGAIDMGAVDIVTYFESGCDAVAVSFDLCVGVGIISEFWHFFVILELCKVRLYCQVVELR